MGESLRQPRPPHRRLPPLEELLGDRPALRLRRGKDGLLRVLAKGLPELALVTVDSSGLPPETRSAAEGLAAQGAAVAVLVTAADPDADLLLWAYRLPGARVIEMEEPPDLQRLEDTLRGAAAAWAAAPPPAHPEARGARPLGRSALSALPERARPEALAAALAGFFLESAHDLRLPPCSLEPEALPLLINQLADERAEDFRRLARDLTLRWPGQRIGRRLLLETLNGPTAGRSGEDGQPAPLRAVLVSLLEGAAPLPYSAEAFRQASPLLERTVIGLALEHAQGNRSRAARSLGITRGTLQARLGQLGLDPAEFRRGRTRAAASPPVPSPVGRRLRLVRPLRER